MIQSEGVDKITIELRDGRIITATAIDGLTVELAPIMESVREMVFEENGNGHLMILPTPDEFLLTIKGNIKKDGLNYDIQNSKFTNKYF